MIVYDSKRNLDIIFRVWGSVFPRAIKFSVPATIAAIILKLLFTHLLGTAEVEDILGSNLSVAGYGSFTAVLGFLLVFRNSQAYNRYWEGKSLIHQMRSEWFESCANLIAFTTLSKNPETEVQKFRHTLVRLFSLMHSCALQEIAVMHEEEFNLLDARGLDHESRDLLLQCQQDGHNKAHLTFQWVLNIIVHNMDNGLLPVPPPILTRVFQEISNGKMHADNALKITDTQFPFPYAQTTVVLLLMHSILSPLVICVYTGSFVVSAILTFVAVFVFWCIHFIAIEIEEPFGDDVNDLPLYELQTEMNQSLIGLLDKATNKVPTLSDEAQMDLGKLLSDNTCWQSLNQSYALQRSKRLVSRDATRTKSLAFPEQEKRDRSLAAALKRVSALGRVSGSLSFSPQRGPKPGSSKGVTNASVVDVRDTENDVQELDVELDRSNSTIRRAGSTDTKQQNPRPPEAQVPKLYVDNLAPGAIDENAYPKVSDVPGAPLRNECETGDESSPAASGIGPGTGLSHCQSSQSTVTSKEAMTIPRAKQGTQNDWT